MRKQSEGPTRRPRYFTDEEKHDVCLAWERSGQAKAVFCDSVGIAKSTFYKWYSQFKTQGNSESKFSPVTLKPSNTVEAEAPLKLETCLPNQTILSISMQKPSLISFIQELSNATTIVR